MRVIFVRHGEPEWHDDDGLGRVDPPLTALGRAQAAAVADALADLAVDALWVSPSARARETAAPIADRLGRDPIVRDWLEEVRIPVIGGKTRDALAELFGAARARTVAGWWSGLDGCESYAEFTARVCGGLDGALGEEGATRVPDGDVALWDGLPERTVVAVCHAGTTAVAVSHLVGLGQVPWSWIRLPSHHCGVSECRSVALSTARIFALSRLNDVAHLDPESRTR